MLSVKISNIAIIATKKVDYCCIIHHFIKFKTINLLENSILENGNIYIYIYIYIYIDIYIYCLKFQCIQVSFSLLLSLFSIYKMGDIVDIYKSLNISIGAVI